MYILPFYIKRYRANISAECLIKNFRFNTLTKYDKDGTIRQSNPRDLICRNELEKIIILRDRPYYSGFSGGTTAVMIADGKNKDELIITTIEFHDWGGILWFLLLFVGAIYSLFVGTNPLLALVVFGFLFFINSLDGAELKRQRAFIEKMIKNCETK